MIYKCFGLHRHATKIDQNLYQYGTTLPKKSVLMRKYSLIVWVSLSAVCLCLSVSVSVSPTSPFVRLCHFVPSYIYHPTWPQWPFYMVALYPYTQDQGAREENLANVTLRMPSLTFDSRPQLERLQKQMAGRSHCPSVLV